MLLLWNLAKAFSLGFWYLDVLGPCPCSQMDRTAHGYRRYWAYQGLRPCRGWSLILESGSHAGTCASLGSSLWNSITRHMGPGLLHGDREQHTQILKETAAERGWRLRKVQVHVPERTGTCLHDQLEDR